ncbi:MULTISPECIES: nuclease-related domain-containing protein [Streptomyces]|uniref:nuclease-related domain-containing protein n=1 Tax=Streptomyces TaxID=1883 RepID=UPI002034BF71|nr:MULTISPECIES: nuclease-related domain-containing protein [Streptomyces]UUA08650.1 NERD domain-containing protein [Streptomyces koelreuteriae]UUA16255.1 NERD domain-containing protein [Streptomyces sp. CRCS-T-1]
MEPLFEDLARNRPGDAVRRKIRELQPNPVLRLLDRWRTESEIRSWSDGLTGERITGKRLNSLRARGWFILHAVQWATGADIDHLAIGPAGVFSINSKRHRDKSVWYGDTAITVNGAVQRHIAISQSEARRVSRALSRRSGIDVPVRPVISVVHAANLTVKNANPPVLVLAVEHLDRVLSGLSPMLDANQVAHIYGVARDARTWAA